MASLRKGKSEPEETECSAPIKAYVVLDSACSTPSSTPKRRMTVFPAIEEGNGEKIDVCMGIK
eukprot:CAMPEP_0117593120 /NCGR_PEP_ID=MMETSP0784-20121206/72450_1 /TAXON_ID=39447 /ORGANISM="" /LENGTH=62 /DNA_ID=CAMNT_0005394995 /DNA_START=121 /DNA_END=309 /DNA_ORIENTATION=-